MALPGLGYLPDLNGALPKYSAVRAAAGPSKPRNILRVLPPRRNQGTIGACVAVTKRSQVYVCTALRGTPYHGSALALYYWTREVRGWEDTDSGCVPSDANKVLKARGLPPESLYEYDTSRWRVRPPASLDAVAERHQALEWHDVPSFDQAAAAIDAEDPVGIGMTWRAAYDGGPVAGSGILPPAFDSGLRGGHEMVVVGYDRDTVLSGWRLPGYLIGMQSWGDWGCVIPEHPTLRTFILIARELVDSDDVSDLDALVDMETL